MKRITKKLLFDLMMTLLWIVLMIYPLTGAYWHEALGLIILGLFGVHILYNIPKITKEIPRIFHSGKMKLLLRYGVSFGLLFFGLFTGISGIFISKEILTGIEATSIPLWTSLHLWSAYITMAIIALHVGLHLKVIVAVIGKPFRQFHNFKKGAKALWNLVIVGVVLYGFISSTQVDFPFGVTDTEETGADSSTETSEITEDSGTQDTLTSQSPTEDEDSAPTLWEFLSSLTCTACHQNCPLSAPKCGRGEDQAWSAQQEYDQLYESAVDLELYVGDTNYVSTLS